MTLSCNLRARRQLVEVIRMPASERSACEWCALHARAGCGVSDPQVPPPQRVLSTRAGDAGRDGLGSTRRHPCSPRARGMRDRGRGHGGAGDVLSTRARDAGKRTAVQNRRFRALHARAGCGLRARTRARGVPCSPRARGMRGSGRITARSVGCLSTRARDAGSEVVAHHRVILPHNSGCGEQVRG